MKMDSKEKRQFITSILKDSKEKGFRFVKFEKKKYFEVTDDKAYEKISRTIDFEIRKMVALTNKEFVADVTETETEPIDNQEKNADDTETEKSIYIEVPENDNEVIEEEDGK